MSNDVRLHDEPALPGAVAIGQAMRWLKTRERKMLLIAVGIQVVVLLGMITSHAIPLLFGQTVLVRVIPVDPRDFFRGDYVILSYDFSRVPPRGIDGLPNHHAGNGWQEQQGQTVYAWLVLEDDGRHWRAERISTKRPERGPYLRGRISGWGQIKYGIEAYYVQEGRGLEYEQAILSQQLSAELAIGPNGTAKLRALHIEKADAGNQRR
jgi:uncharacterized membrane-anchored protein